MASCLSGSSVKIPPVCPEFPMVTLPPSRGLPLGLVGVLCLAGPWGLHWHLELSRLTLGLSGWRQHEADGLG